MLYVIKYAKNKWTYRYWNQAASCGRFQYWFVWTTIVIYGGWLKSKGKIWHGRKKRIVIIVIFHILGEIIYTANKCI